TIESHALVAERVEDRDLRQRTVAQRRAERALGHALEIDLRRRDRLVPEVAADDLDRDAFGAQPDRTGLAQLMPGPPPPDAGEAAERMEPAPDVVVVPLAAGGWAVDDTQQRSVGELGPELAPRLEQGPEPVVDVDVAGVAVLALRDVDVALLGVQVVLVEA